MDDSDYEPPTTFQGRLQRGRGLVVHHAPTIRGAADLVYECVITDTRWDRQIEHRGSYLARLIHRLDLPLAPIEQHLFSHDTGEVGLTLQVLALLPLIGRADAVAILRRYAVEGRHWALALEAIEDSGAQKIPQIWTGLDHDVLAVHDDTQLTAEIGAGWEPWESWAHDHARIRRILDAHAAGRRRSPIRHQAPDDHTKVSTTVLTQRAITSTSGRRQALLELGRRGDLVVLDLAEDANLRNVAGHTPGMHRALHLLGSAAVTRARGWIGSADEPLEALAVGVLSEFGEHEDGPYLLERLTRAMSDGAWCAAETPARGLGRLGLSEATDALLHYWEATIHSSAREAILEGLRGCARRAADAQAVEALDDCEPAVQQIACALAPDSGHVRARLVELRGDPLASEIRGTIVRRLKEGRAAVRPRQA